MRCDRDGRPVDLVDRSIDRTRGFLRSRRNIRSTSSVVIVRRRQCATTTVPDDDDARLRRVDAAHRDAYTPWGVVRSRTHPSRADDDDDDDDGDGDGDARDRSRDDDDGGVGARGARGANERCDARRASTNGRARCV